MNFVEVLLSVFMVGLLLGSSLLMQNTTISHVFLSSARMQRIVVLSTQLKKIMQELRQKDESVESKKITIQAPLTELLYTEKKPADKSSLKKFNNIVIRKMVATWDLAGNKEEETMLVISFKPKKQS